MRKTFLPFCKPTISQREINEVTKVLKSGWLTTGPKTEEFEQKFAQYVEAEHAIAVSSGTDALHLSLAALKIKPGDEVITTPFTFIATAQVIEWLGARPVFVDIDPVTYNINPDQIKRKINFSTKAIMPVHVAGHPCNMDALMELSKDYGVPIIEDAAHAVGSEYKGKKIGSIGTTTCFSFYATKNLATGEGGMITTNDESMAKRLKQLSYFGVNKEAFKRYSNKGNWFYDVEFMGYKCNMDNIHAAIGVEQLKKIDSFNAKRKNIADYYRKHLGTIPGVQLPAEVGDIKHAWHIYPVQLPKMVKRAEFVDAMKKKNIGVSVHFMPVHLFSHFKSIYGFKKGEFPISEAVYDRLVTLPLYPLMTLQDAEDVVEAFKQCIKK